MQVASLNVLARLYIARFQYGDAAAVYAALAQRKAGLGDQAVDLAERLDLYQSAVLQACSPASLFGHLHHESSQSLPCYVVNELWVCYCPFWVS